MRFDGSVLELIGRNSALFEEDFGQLNEGLKAEIHKARFLVIGGAGTIGQAVVREIFRREPAALHVVDISENNMVELVRDIRSTLGYIQGDFRTFAVDCGSREFEALVNAEGPYDYVLNLSALKHVRSEKDPFTLMRMVEVNVFNTLKTLAMARNGNAKKYFCVSTDKAANPVNMMGASKRIMEMFLMRESLTQPIAMARFANVAFSDGSLLHGLNQRVAKRQPVSAPKDVRRYFVTQQESGEICLLACLLGANREIFFPKLSEKLHLVSFPEIILRYLQHLGFSPYECSSEDEARRRTQELILQKKWPCYFFDSDTTGEKEFEEFYTDREELDLARFKTIGVIRQSSGFDAAALNRFSCGISEIYAQSTWTKGDILRLFLDVLPGFAHRETGKYLDQRM